MREITVKREFPLALRQILTSKYVKIVHSVWAASKHWKANTGKKCAANSCCCFDSSFLQSKSFFKNNHFAYFSFADYPFGRRVELLNRDIINAPFHYFGQHAVCADYFCTGPKENEVDTVQKCLLPENRKFWDAVVGLANHYAGFASSLIYCLDNNLAEQFNGVIAQKVNGKRSNFSQRGGAVTRSYAAVASFNTSGRYHEVVHSVALGHGAIGQYSIIVALSRDQVSCSAALEVCS